MLKEIFRPHLHPCIPGSTDPRLVRSAERRLRSSFSGIATSYIYPGDPQLSANRGVPFALQAGKRRHAHPQAIKHLNLLRLLTPAAARCPSSETSAQMALTFAATEPPASSVDAESRYRGGVCRTEHNRSSVADSRTLQGWYGGTSNLLFRREHSPVT